MLARQRKNLPLIQSFSAPITKKEETTILCKFFNFILFSVSYFFKKANYSTKFTSRSSSKYRSKDMELTNMRLTLILLWSSCIAKEQIYLPLEAGGCLPSLPCGNKCFEYKALNSTTVTIGKRHGCNRTNSSKTYCQCQTSVCHKLDDFCLSTCKQHDSEAIKTCIACLEKLSQSPRNDNTEGHSSCRGLCSGMCVDFDCGLNVISTIEKNCSACIPGYTGKSCRDRCSPGCSGKCHPESGYCLDCPAGMFGPECELACPRGCLSGNCSTSWGTCETCDLGYWGENCSKPCSEGFYGSNCSMRCSKTCKDDFCDTAKGVCIHGCKPGYFGLHCKQPCPKMTYGEDCLSQCPVTCSRNLPCHHETGACVSGCETGFHGTHCNLTCVEHRYGENCDFNCSENCFRALCNPFSGICLTCIEPFYGPMCEFQINVDNIDQGVLGTEITSGEALMMISGIGMLGVLMWIAVSYLLLSQRKRILKDAAKGIDPRTTQWGMFPNSRAFSRALRLYDSKMEELGGGDAGTSSKRKRHEDTKRQSYTGNRIRRKKILSKALKEAKHSKRLLWWNRPEAEKPSPPNAVDVERVSKWLSRYHGIKQLGKEGDVVRIAESVTADNIDTAKKDASATKSNTDTAINDVKVTKQLSKECLMVFEKENSGKPTSCAEEEKEKLTEPSQSRTAQEATYSVNDTRNFEDTSVLLNQTQTVKDQTPSVTVTHSLKDQTQPGISLSPSCEYHFNNVPIRKDSIFLSPKAHPGGPNVIPEPVNNINWIQERLRYSSGNTRPNSTSSGEDASIATTSATFSRSGTTSSSSSLSTSGSTVTETDTFWRANKEISDYTSSDDSSGSFTTDESEGDASYGSSLSTVVTAEKDKSTLEKQHSSQGESEDAVARPIMKDADTDTDDEPKAPGIFQKLVNVFKRVKPKSTQAQPVAQQTTLSVPGAGGLPRPFSHKFLINRLETWSRNRGMEVTMNDGMLEVAEGLNQGRISRQAQPDKMLEVPDESSWISLDVSENTQDKGESSLKPTSGSTDIEPKTTTTATRGGKHDSTSGDDIMSDLPTTLISGNAKYSGGRTY